MSVTTADYPHFLFTADCDKFLGNLYQFVRGKFSHFCWEPALL
jgi:hypothetical protein